MNVLPLKRDVEPTFVTNDIELEQAVLHAMLSSTEALRTFTGSTVTDDFTHPVHRRLADHLLDLVGTGRQPSVAAALALFGDDELEPGLTAKHYVGRLFIGGTSMLFAAPLRDLHETWRGHVARRNVFQAGSHLQLCMTTELDIAQLAREGIDALNDVLAGFRQGRSESYTGKDAILAALDDMHADAEKIVTTGLTDLDHVLGGWPRGELVIVAGRPGMGKSAFTVSSVARAAHSGLGAVVFSLEMTRKQMGARLAADLAYVASDRICYEDIGKKRINGQRQVSRLENAAELAEAIRIEEQRGVTVSEIAAKCRRIANEFDGTGKRLDVVFVDHIGLVKASSRYAGVRHREVAEVTDGLATLAKELDCAVVGLCQLNRGVEGRESKRPGLSDLRDSGAIEEDASAVVFLYREAYYLQMQGKRDDYDDEMRRQALLEAHENRLELIVAKNRNGRTGLVSAYCDIGANAIRNLDFGGS